MEEIRFLSDSNVNVRSLTENEEVIEGYASVFDKESKLISDKGKKFYEIINRNAFDNALGRHDLDVIMNRDHDNTRVLARSKSGTLTLSVDDYGLKYTFTPPDTPLGQETLELVKRGDLYESSFKYIVIDRPEYVKWWRGNDGVLRREILDIRALKDTSIVTFGAFKDTDVVARGLDEFEAKEAEEESIRKQELANYFIQLENRIL